MHASSEEDARQGTTLRWAHNATRLHALGGATCLQLIAVKMSEEGECPKPAIEESCKPECMKQLLAYQRCAKRIKGHSGAHCTGQYFDYYACIDHCTAPRLFSVLK